MPRTLTAPLAEVRVNGQKVGYMKNIRVREQYRRTTVKGIGRLNGIEAPATDFEGSLSCQFYNISLKDSGMPGAINRNAPSVEDLVNGVLLQETGFDVTIMRKKGNGVDPTTGAPIIVFEPYTTIRGCFLQSDDFDISEGQISGKNQEFIYLDPVLGLG